MHELSIAEALVSQLKDVARDQSATHVLALTVDVGPLSGLDPEALQFAFPMAAEDTVAAGATLHIQKTEAELECRGCKRRSRPTFPIFACSHCGSTDVEVHGGRELLLKSVELELPDPVIDTGRRRD